MDHPSLREFVDAVQKLSDLDAEQRAASSRVTAEFRFLQTYISSLKRDVTALRSVCRKLVDYYGDPKCYKRNGKGGPAILSDKGEVVQDALVELHRFNVTLADTTEDGQ